MRKFFVYVAVARAMMAFAGPAAAQDDVYVETDGETTVVMDNEGHAVVIEE